MFFLKREDKGKKDLRGHLQGRNSGGVFLTTIHKFTEDTQLLTDRCNVICISDEAHRSQTNLDQKLRVTDKGVYKSYGFAKYLHDFLPNATYVGFTGTPVDATLDVFGDVVDAYTMTESVKDEITVRIVYEGRAAKVMLNNSKLEEIEKYYAECAEEGANEYQIEDSKRATANMNAIIGDPDRIRAVADDFVQLTQELEKRFMFLVKRLKAAYDICSGTDVFTEKERDTIHFYLAVRSIVFKLTKGDAPDTAQMNAKVREMIKDALLSEGVEEIFKLGDGKNTQTDIFGDDYLAKIEKIKLPNTKIKLLQQLLAKAIDFSRKMNDLVSKYNERKEDDVLRSEVLEDFTDEIIDLYNALRREKESFNDMDIDFEEKAFYDILKTLAEKYDFSYPEDKLIALAREVKIVVDDKAKYIDWSKREDIKAELKVDLIILLAENDYPPVDKDEVYKEIFEQAENFKKYLEV